MPTRAGPLSPGDTPGPAVAAERRFLWNDSRPASGAFFPEALTTRFVPEITSLCGVEAPAAALSGAAVGDGGAKLRLSSRSKRPQMQVKSRAPEAWAGAVPLLRNRLRRQRRLRERPAGVHNVSLGPPILLGTLTMPRGSAPMRPPENGQKPSNADTGSGCGC